MRIRSRKLLAYKNVLVVLFSLLPLSYFGYFGYRINGMYSDLGSLSYLYEPDPSTFINANYSRLSEMAEFYDYRYEAFHIPLNLSVATQFTGENLSTVLRYHYSDNCALWTGIAIAGWVGKYLSAIRENNTEMVENATRVLRKLIHGFSMLMAVPNGGLGPEYPGILARGWAAPEHQTIASMYFQESIRHFNGSGIYSQYRWRGYTSNDEYGGFYMGLALALKYVDDPYVQSTVRLMIEQVANFNVKNNFLGINGPGGLTGVNQKPKFGSGGFWVPLLLKMAAMVNPEKYERLYYRWVIEEMALLSNAEGGDQETTSNYYAYNFGHCTVFAYLMLEGPETRIGQRFFNGYLQTLRKYTMNHRNAYFNAIYLAILERFNKTDPNGDLIKRDVEDQLMRIDGVHFPDTYRGVEPIPDDWPIAGVIEDLKEWLDEDPYGTIFKAALPEVNLERTYYARPLSIEMRSTSIFPWEKNPYIEPKSYNIPTLEEAGMIFTVPYWILRGFVGIPNSGVRG
jgi:hypothetical protein